LNGSELGELNIALMFIRVRFGKIDKPKKLGCDLARSVDLRNWNRILAGILSALG
jgi:hypothetical protein